MPINNDFAFTVLVDGQRLHEYDSGEKIFVESSTEASTSYKILAENGNEVMVTPYKILLEVPKKAPPRFYLLFIDGRQITRAFLRGGNKRTFWGTLDNSEMKEFVFTFPVEPRQDDCHQSEQNVEGLGTVVIQAMEAIDTGVKEYYYQAKFRPLAEREENGRGTACLKTLKEISKKDTMKITNGQYPLLYSGMGHTVMVKELSPCHKLRTQYVTGQLVSSITLHYRTRLALELLGVISPTNDQCYDTKTNEENVPVTKQIPAEKNIALSTETEVGEVKLPVNILPIFNSDEQHENDVKVKEFEKDQFRTKQELKYDNDEDDVELNDSDVEITAVSFNELQPVKGEQSEEVMWQDKSIIWEGDDDCLITYVRKPWDISLIELTDSDDEEHLTDEQPATTDDDVGDDKKTSCSS